MRTTEFHGAVAAHPDDEAAEAVFQARGMEVQADAKMAHAEVGEKLGFMVGENGGEGFDFEDDGVSEHDVGAKSPGMSLRIG